MEKSRNTKLITEVGNRYTYEELLQLEKARNATVKTRGLHEVVEKIEETLQNFINKQKKRGAATTITTETTPISATPETPTPTEPITTEPTTTPPADVLTPPIATPPPALPPATLNFSDLIQENLSDANGEYFRAIYPKKQIYIHHTVSNGNPLGPINWWRKQANGVATFVVIAGKQLTPQAAYKDGDIYQCFSSKYWAHHLGLKQEHLLSNGLSNIQLNRASIAIELCSWGALSKNADGTFSPISYPQVILQADEVQRYPQKYKGVEYYQKYTTAQIESLRKMLVYLCDTYKIDPTYKGDAIFDVDRRALKGENGIFTHTSVRPDKSDCHPQPELIAMLKGL